MKILYFFVILILFKLKIFKNKKQKIEIIFLNNLLYYLNNKKLIVKLLYFDYKFL